MTEEDDPDRKRQRTELELLTEVEAGSCGQLLTEVEAGSCGANLMAN